MQRIIVLFFLAVSLFATDTDEIPLLQWAGPPGSRPGTYEEWIAEHPYTPFYYTLDRVFHGDGRSGNVAILTEQNLAQHLSSEIDRLSDQLQNEGYTVFSYEITGGTPETLRTFLNGIYAGDSIEGVLLIGDLPVAWFEVYDFGGSLTQFPMDLFYMDLDGTWLDTISTGNGRYDGHTGSMKPEIYVGRLLPTGIGVDTVVLKNYFEKNQDYRDGLLTLPERALVFVDDDWYSWALQWTMDVTLLFPDTMSYWDPETTRASLYRERLDTLQAWVSVFAHSWPAGHQFVFNNGAQYDYYYASEYVSQNPPTCFYNFFACSFCRYTDNGYGGGRAIFNDDYGIGVIGSTKSGSMLDFDYFYRPLGQRANLGQAFKYWFDCIYDSVGMSFDRLCWHYGMTLLGDPFLKPTGHSTAIAESPKPVAPGHELSIRNTFATQQVSLTLHLETAQRVRITLYDCTGRHISETANERLAGGTHYLTIKMRDESGNVLPSGIYILRATIGNSVLTRKILKIE
ncbi:MAG: T9SS type A sorting domain-containing protein [bacterium]